MADPVTVAHPMWFATYGTVVVDGIMDPEEWGGSVPITKAGGNRPDQSVSMRLKYTELGLYVGLDVKDQYLWADGAGGGDHSRYDWYNDDSMALYFDASNTRKQFLTPAGRALFFNIGVAGVPGAVKRYNYIAGNNPHGNDGDLFGVQVNPFGALNPGMTWRTVLHGTVNDNSDLDEGWTTEVFLPWDSIGMGGMPVNGQDITMNFSVLFDDTGGSRNDANYDNDPDPNMRFGPRKLDDQINGVESSFNISTPGMQGPVDYAWVTFNNPNVNDKPNPVINLSVGAVDGYSVRLNFLAPAGSSGCMVLGPAKRGGVYQYQIRWSDVPIIDEVSWGGATEVPNTFAPHPRGIPDSLHIGGLDPSTHYYMAIRAVDALGRLSDIRQVSFTTQSNSTDITGGDRLMTSPAGGNLVFEGSQDPFTMIANAVNPGSLYIRNLYPGNIWNPSNQTFMNFTQNPGREGDAAGYFDALAETGVNTLRVSLEWLGAVAANQLTSLNGTYWIESRPGVFNPDMRNFLWSMMAEANRTGMRLVLEPFDTFDYRSYFALSPFAKANGGPLDTIDDFFQNGAVMNIVINRMKTIVDWINQSPYPQAVLGIYLPNEWDNWQWTLSPRGNGDPARNQEMRDRSKVILRTAAAVHAYAPNMLIISSTDALVPRGPEARALYLGDNIDVLAPHLYTTTTAEPVNSPDAEKSIRPVTDYGALAGYWLTQRRDNRALFNGEWGLVKWLWDTGKTYYTGVSSDADPAKPWTVQEDVDLYRTTSWTQMAMGMAGAGLRLAGKEMRDLTPDNMSPQTTGYLTTPFPQGMRDVQYTVSAFAADTTIDFDAVHYRPMPLAGRLGFGDTTSRLIGVGSSDGTQGMVYVVQDLNRTTGTVEGATLNIQGLAEGAFVNVEFWSTGTGGQQLSVEWGLTVSGGTLAVPMPDFDTDVMVRFKVAA